MNAGSECPNHCDTTAMGTPCKCISVPPSGLRSLIGTAASVLGGNYANADSFAEAISVIEQTGTSPTAFVANASTVLALSKLKKATGSNEPLLEPPTALGATQRLQRHSSV